MKKTLELPIKSKTLLAVFLGLSLSAILLTNYRLTDSVGFGEMGLLIYIILALTISAARNNLTILKRHNLYLFQLLYVLTIFLSLTVASHHYLDIGSSFRDYTAILLCVAFTIALSLRQENVKVTTMSLLVFLTLFTTYQYFFGGESAWYSSRFTGGAKNPNQMALYAVCAILLAGIFVKNWKHKLLAVCVFIFFGWVSFSDAFLAYLALMALLLPTMYYVGNKYRLIALVSLTLLLLLILLLFSDFVFNYLGREWASADQGGARTTLYLNGIRAWLSSVTSAFIGNGAGSFSGLNGPFESAESHSTPIEILSMGGILGFFVFYSTSIKNLVYSYKNNYFLVFFLFFGLIFFSLFHYVFRHPIVWFCIYAVSEYIALRNATPPQSTEL